MKAKCWQSIQAFNALFFSRRLMGPCSVVLALPLNACQASLNMCLRMPLLRVRKRAAWPVGQVSVLAFGQADDTRRF